MMAMVMMTIAITMTMAMVMMTMAMTMATAMALLMAIRLGAGQAAIQAAMVALCRPGPDMQCPKIYIVYSLFFVYFVTLNTYKMCWGTLIIKAVLNFTAATYQTAHCA